MYDRDATAYAASRGQKLRAAGAAAIAGLQLDGVGVVVDVACGTGTGLAELRRIAPSARVLGLDLSARMLRLVDASQPVLQADAAALPLVDGGADALVCCFALMHMVSPAEAVAEFARVLRPGGAIAITTWGPDVAWPAHAAVLQILDDLGAPKVASSHHGAPITESPENVASLLRGAGFESVTVERRPFDDTCGDAEAALYEWGSLGSTATRLSLLEPLARQEFFARARVVMAGFDPAGFADPSDVIYAWGVRS